MQTARLSNLHRLRAFFQRGPRWMLRTVARAVVCRLRDWQGPPLLSDLRPPHLPFRTPVVTPPASGLLDVPWYHRYLIITADLWNGGLDGAHGMGVYRADFDGFFHVYLDRRFRSARINVTTALAHSRAIYLNAEALRAAGPETGARFRHAIEFGTRVLLDRYRDPAYGGIYWQVTPRGRISSDYKRGYGNVHALFALAHAYGATGDAALLAAALAQFEVIETHFLDPAHPGACRPGFSRDFTTPCGSNNSNDCLHYFEALLALFDVTAGPTRERVAARIREAGAFQIERLIQPEDGHPERAYLPAAFTADWQPSSIPYTARTHHEAAYATPGHAIELAYFLSRAVERGFDPAWLAASDRLLAFCLAHAIDPQTGGMRRYITDEAGRPLPADPERRYYLWWPQGETMRALLHFAIVRGRDDLIEPFQRIQRLVNDRLTDHEYGGWVRWLDAEAGLAPVGFDKGDYSRINYHFTMLYVEVLRLAAAYPDRVAGTAQVRPHPRPTT